MSVIKTMMVMAIFCFASFANAEININTATVQQLTEMDNIGAVKAEAIVEYRDKHGLFQSVDDLLKVDGIGMATLEANRNMLTIGMDAIPTLPVEKSMSIKEHTQSGIATPSGTKDH